MLEDTVNLNEELEQAKEANEGIAEEYKKFLELSMQSKRNTNVSEQLSKLIHMDTMDDEDTPEEVQAVVDFITGPESSWCSGRPETKEFRSLIQDSFFAEWRDFSAGDPNASLHGSMEQLPQRFFAPPLAAPQFDSLSKSHQSIFNAASGGFFRAKIRFLDLKGRRCTTTREFEFRQTALSAIEDTMQRIFTVTNFTSTPESLNRQTCDFIFRVHGLNEYIYGGEQLIDFRYIRDSLVKDLEVNLTIEPFEYAKLQHPRFYPHYRSIQKPNKTHAELTVMSIDNLEAGDGALSIWEIGENVVVCVDELSNMSVPVERVKQENLRDGDDVWVCLVGEIVFGTNSVCLPQCTPWRCCRSLVGASTVSTAVWGPKGNLVFDVNVSDLPRECKLCISIAAVSGDNFLQVSHFTASQMLDDSMKGQAKKFRRFVNLINPLGGVDEEQASSVFYLGSVSVQLFDHTAHLRMGHVDVCMWSGEERCNPIGTNSLNPDKAAIGLQLVFPTYARPVVHPAGEPPQTKKRDQELSHEDNLMRLDIQIRDNEITQLRHVKRILSTDPLYAPTISDKVLLWKYREELLRRPKALCKFLLSVNWMKPYAVYEAHQLLSRWSSMQPMDALELLDARYADTRVREHAVACLETTDDHELKGCILQLVQVLKYEPYHYNALSRFLLRRSIRSPHVIGHFVFWHLVAEMSNNKICERHGLLIEEMLKRHPRRRDLLRQQYVVDQLLGAAMKIKNEPKKDRIPTVRELLRNIRFPRRFTLALNPAMECSGLDIAKCKVMDSKKLPLWLVFRNSQEEGDSIYIMFKAGDDLRQDLLTLQLLALMDNVWKQAGLDLHLIPYGCVATGEGVGMIEIVLKSDTIANITRKYGGAQAALSEEPLMHWLRKFNRLPAEVQRCLWNFVYSTSGYTVATYILGIGDRHNDNIMVREDGTLFHIDFGHFLGNFKTKFGFKRETAPFIFTPMYAYMMGGTSSPIYAHFCDVACQAYNVIRRYSNTLIILFMLMLSTGIPELQKVEDIFWLKSVLLIDRTDEEASAHYKTQIGEALNNKRTLINDYIHILAH